LRDQDADRLLKDDRKKAGTAGNFSGSARSNAPTYPLPSKPRKLGRRRPPGQAFPGRVGGMGGGPRPIPAPPWCLGQNSGCSTTAPYLDPAVARKIFGPSRDIHAGTSQGQGRPIPFEAAG
jgi:hypothetical protein